MNYRILSLAHSPWGNYAVWWGPNDCGYTSELNTAGVYSHEQVNSNISYYDNGITTRAIPADDLHPVHVVDWNKLQKTVLKKANT